MKLIFPLFSSISWRTYWIQLRHYGIAILIFLIGVLLSLAAFRFYQIQNINRTHAEFNRIADLRLFMIRDILLETLQQMESIAQFYYASPKASKENFQIFVRHIFHRSPNYLALGWIQEDLLLNPSIKSAVGLNFIDLQDAHTHSLFYPFTYLTKSDLHHDFYLDSMDYAMFVHLLQESQNEAGVTISGRVTYFEERKKFGFFLFEPIFLKGRKFHPPEKGLFGIIVGFSNFENIVENIRARVEPAGINISIYDVSQENEHLLYWNSAVILKDPLSLNPRERRLQENWARNQIFKFSNHTWKLQATATLEFIQLHQKHYWPHWEVPIIGILISGLTASYFLVLVNRRMSIEQEVLDRTNELANTNRILQQEIHERQRIEEDFMANQHYLQRRHEALEYLTKLTISELHNAIHEVILRTAIVMRVDRIGVWFYEVVNHTEILTCAGLYILSTNSFSNHLEINSLYFPHYFAALSKRSHLILPSPQDAELNQELSSYLAAFHINSKLDIPIIFEGNLLGVLSCEETRGHREWTLEDRHFGQTIADIIAIMIEQSARHKAEKALQDSEERLRFIRQQSIDGIISINDREEIVSWNYGAQQMFGYQDKEILGKSLRLVIPQDDFFLQKEISTKPIELNGRHQDGHLFPVEISQTRWEESPGVYFDTIIIRDITERKEYEKRLIKAMREAREASAAKSEFLATISHELRTPLNAIIGFNECLLIGMDGPISSAQQESLKKIEKSSFHLLNLINDILDWSKIEARKMELEIMPQNIVELMISCVEEMQPLAHQKNLDIQLSISHSFILVEMDRVRIRQVLLNLLSNAIKFTQKGYIKISLFSEPDQIRIQVSDTGIGMSPEEMEKIFRPFSQADSSITRKYGGTGLGLVISKNIIDLHGGKISVESQKGYGSTFTIILPKTR
jgi:PAS domain S-box-containing protein